MRVVIKGGIFKRAMNCEAWQEAGEISFEGGITSDFGNLIFLEPYTIDTEILDVDTRDIEVAALKGAIAKERADSSVRVLAYESAINKLLCIEG